MSEKKTKVEKPEIDITMYYSKEYDLWVGDVRLNAPVEKLLSTFRADGSKVYSLPNAQKRERYRMLNSFVGKMEDKGQIEQSVLCSLFDKEHFGTGKRFFFAPDYFGGIKRINYMKELLARIAKESVVLSRKIEAVIKVV